ncbi:MAG: efflux RND transporter periplasmic adaptor subunit [Saprospiraceae bacterium]
MKELVFIIVIALLASCNSEKSIGENPTTIEGKRALLIKKKESLKNLESEIAELTQDLIKTDPSLVKKKKIVTTLPVTASTFIKYIDLEGMVIADKKANAVSEILGRITKITVKEGDYVKKGAFIATLDMSTSRTQKNDIITNLSLAKDIFEKRSRLWAQNIGSEIQYLEAKNNVSRLERSLELIDLMLTKGTVYAPISGVVDRELLKQGELASPGMPIVQILNTRDIKVEVDLPERYLSILKKGMRVSVYFPSLDITQQGRVSLLGRSIDPANRTLKFEVDLNNKNGLLKPNLLAELQMVEKSIDNVITIPLEMIQQDVNNNSFVMKVVEIKGELIAVRSEVTVGDIYKGFAIVEKGITFDDILIKDGARLVSDMEQVKIIGENTEEND